MKSRPMPLGGASPGNPLTPGTLLAGRYQIEKVIGAGGMGAVYSARDRRFRTVVRRCAVKEMFDTIAEPGARQRARENFEREANLLASLNHNAIPKVFDYFTEGDRHYLVYELIDGQDLGRVLHQRSRPLPPERVLDWSVQLTRVLEMLHTSDPPIIFRDLKPSNVILRNDGQIVLVDFGIAKHFQPVQKGTMIGTEGYAPPEQYEGVANPRVDIYALGATMHQLLTNTDPQEYRPFSFPQRAIRQFNPAVSAELDAIVMRALAYEPSDRWENMAALRQALERVLRAGDEPKPPPASSPTRPVGSEPASKAERSTSRGAAASGLFARHLMNRTAKEKGDESRPVPPREEATRPVASDPSPARPVPPQEGATRPVSGGGAPSHSPSSAGPAANVPHEAGEIDPNAAIVPLWTFATEDEVRSTPEIHENSVFIGSYDNNLYCIDLTTGDFLWKYPTSGGIPGGPAVAGELVIFGSEDHQVYGINRRTGRMEWTSQTQGMVRSSPRVAMNYIFIGSDDGHVYAFNSLRGHMHWKANIGAPVRSSAAIGEELLFIGAEDGSVAGIHMTIGDIMWQVRANGPVISSPVIAGQRVIFGSMDRQVYGVDSRSGWVVWRVRMADRVYSSPYLVDDRVYISSVDGTIYCLEAEWGKEIWRTKIGSQVTSSPIIDPEGRLFVGGIDGALYCLDARKGKTLWHFKTGGPIPGSPRLHKGVVIFGSMDHRVYALPTAASPRSF